MANMPPAKRAAAPRKLPAHSGILTTYNDPKENEVKKELSLASFIPRSAPPRDTAMKIPSAVDRLSVGKDSTVSTWTADHDGTSRPKKWNTETNKTAYRKIGIESQVGQLRRSELAEERAQRSFPWTSHHRACLSDQFDPSESRMRPDLVLSVNNWPFVI